MRQWRYPQRTQSNAASFSPVDETAGISPDDEEMAATFLDMGDLVSEEALSAHSEAAPPDPDLPCDLGFEEESFVTFPATTLAVPSATSATSSFP
jgi:hypothetical protein